MQVLENIWLFFQDQILGMKWMTVLIGNGLSALGIDMESKLGGMLQFFIYDTIKIFILLSVLIFIILISKVSFHRKGVSGYWGGFMESGRIF